MENSKEFFKKIITNMLESLMEENYKKLEEVSVLPEEFRYYTPSTDEFVADFEFEYYDNTTHKMVLLDFSSNEPPKEISPIIEVGWIKCKVDWKYPETKIVKENIKDNDGNDCTLEYNGFTANFFSPFYHRNIQELIDNGKIRARKQ